MVELNRIFSKQ